MKNEKQINNIKKNQVQREANDGESGQELGFEDQGATTVVDSASPRENLKQDEVMCSGMWELQQEKAQDTRGQSPPIVIRGEVDQRASV